jgi:hypothetical protein
MYYAKFSLVPCDLILLHILVSQHLLITIMYFKHSRISSKLLSIFLSFLHFGSHFKSWILVSQSIAAHKSCWSRACRTLKIGIQFWHIPNNKIFCECQDLTPLYKMELFIIGLGIPKWQQGYLPDSGFLL